MRPDVLTGLFAMSVGPDSSNGGFSREGVSGIDNHAANTDSASSMPLRLRLEKSCAE
jgi:hypothetical protein